jgi:hypothetical protein
MRSHDTLFVDADEKAFGEELRAFQRPSIRMHHKSVVPPCGASVWGLLISRVLARFAIGYKFRAAAWWDFCEYSA